jgi:hypothetical protein
VRRSRLIDAKAILPEITHLLQGHMHVHLIRAPIEVPWLLDVSSKYLGILVEVASPGSTPDAALRR